MKMKRVEWRVSGEWYKHKQYYFWRELISHAPFTDEFVDGQTIGQLAGEFIDGQTTDQLTGTFVDGQTIGQLAGEFVDGQKIGEIGQLTGTFVDGQTMSISTTMA